MNSKGTNKWPSATGEGEWKTITVSIGGSTKQELLKILGVRECLNHPLYVHTFPRAVSFFRWRENEIRGRCGADE